ncbi:MAG TPA: hypothetical protein VK900_15350 [Anaerolineales bacterium]|nr:hypothetical protein [Anaerolineales bacterium]
MLAVLITLLATPTLAVDPLSDQQPALGTEVRLFEARADDSAGPDAVVSWNAIALRTVIQVARQNQPHSQMYLARIQAAVYNAVVASEGSCQPYKSNLTAQLLKSIPLA